MDYLISDKMKLNFTTKRFDSEFCFYFYDSNNRVALEVPTINCFSKCIISRFGMSIRDRLKTAYENVALNGDTTWTDSTNTFQEANKKLYSKEQQLNNIRIVEERPRTVKDSIPNSKLATYNDYEYNEARELCYTRYIQKTRIEFLSKSGANDKCDEPWLLPDVDSLFMWFICCQNRSRNDCGAFESCNEHGLKRNIPVENEEISIVSPLLDASGFQEKKLRMTIISGRCKAFARDIELTVSKLPKLQSFDSTCEHHRHSKFLDDVSEAVIDFDHLKDLARSFKEQNTWITKCPTKIEELTEPEPEEPYQEAAKIEPISSKRLYSAVLQGLSTTETTKKLEPNILPIERSQDSKALSSVKSILPSFASCCTTSISTVTVLNSNTKQSENGERSTPVSKLIVTQDVKIQKNMSLQTNIKSSPKTKTNDLIAKSHVNRDSLQNNEDPNLRCSNTGSYPFVAQPSMSYINNYNYQLNASHYSNTFQNSCGCTNTYSHTSQVITNRNMQAYQRQTPFFPSQYQYAQPIFMLQQNRTSVYPLSQPVQPPYYFQPLQQTRLMQRWIVPQNYSRPNVNQHNYTVQPHFAQQNSTIWMGSNQQPVASTSQYHVENRTKSKPKRPVQPQISILKSKTRKPQDENSLSTETTDRSFCANSTSSGLEVSTPLVAQLKKLTISPQVKVKSDLEEVVNKTVNILFEDETHVPVTSTLSEELEIQALEQYCNSTDNVYQELERQAAEQYDELSENSRSPPTRDIFFGGLSCFFACSIDVNV
ncbi:hypothetical protein HHI36_002228 [Cryptolaemus montrouzieri]|uniref:Uncharacterized protein n=1 Tax=Cryptolaemus montrouzieri TaxID=559131 RepID=A0ABD2PAS8_9CUCU